MKIVFMGTPSFSVKSLEVLLERNDDIALVVTQPDTFIGRKKERSVPAVKQNALEHGLSVYQPTSIRTREAIDTILKSDPDLIVVTAYGKLLPERLLKTPRYGCINVHASLLPKYRGASPIQSAILHGETKTGITTIQMTEQMDAGDILKQDELTILPDDTSDTLFARLADLSKTTLAATLEALENNTLIPKKQDADAATFCGMLDKKSGSIDWSMQDFQIINQSRAMTPWPGVYTFYDGNKWKLYSLTTGTKDHRAEPGTIVALHENAVEVQTKNGTVLIGEIQREGKKRMPVSDFLRGTAIEIGDQFLSDRR